MSVFSGVFRNRVTNFNVSGKLSFGDGDTYFYETADDALGVRIGGTLKWIMTAFELGSAAVGGGRIGSAGAGATTPGFLFQGDANTGVGRAGPDALSHIAGGVEGMRITNTGSGINVDIKGDLNAVVSAGAVVTSGGQMVFN